MRQFRPYDKNQPQFGLVFLYLSVTRQISLRFRICFALTRIIKQEMRCVALSLIPCKEPCKYQVDGYCELNEISRITAQKISGCQYFQPRSIGSNPLIDHSESLRQSADAE